MNPHHITILALTLLTPLSLARSEDPKKPDPAPPPTPAKEEPKNTPPAADAPAPAEEPAPADDLPTLDEMLGLETEEDANLRKMLEDYDPDKVQLERALTAQEAAEKLQQAVQQMHETAFRLEEIRDSGIVTQRLQAEILTKLDLLIKNAESQSQSQGQSSSSGQSKSGEQNEQMPQKGEQPGQQQGQQQPGAQDGGGNVPFQEGQRDQFEAAKAAWGALPDRVRDRLMEGTNDDFSEWYRALTEAYYKAIADEASKK